MTENIQPDEPQPSSAIVPSNQVSSSLDPIEQSLYEKMQLATTPEEMQSLLNFVEQRRVQIERKAFTDLQLQETKNQINYERKLRVYKEGLGITFSITSVLLGIYLLGSIPLISPLLIILGLIKPLGYSISDVVELMKGFTQSEKPSKELLGDKKPERGNQSNQDPIDE